MITRNCRREKENMNKQNDLEKQLFLRQSGELSSQDQKRLEAMLAVEPASREQARKLDALRNAWQQATAETPLPGPAIMQRIRQAAESTQNRGGRTAQLIPFRLPPFGIAMAAAAAAIAIGATLFLTVWSPTVSEPNQLAGLDPVDTAIEAALEAIDTSMLALLDEPSDDYEELLSNDS